MSSWAGRRISWVSSISYVTRGDFVYYDWTGNGGWDHVAVCVGTNSLGQKIVDAHTTDHYHVYWKLGTSSTKYKFARVRASMGRELSQQRQGPRPAAAGEPA